jgi:hypothetical protein
MLRKTVMLALIVAAVAFMGSCTKATRLTGTLILQTGQSGDVQNSKVQLFVSQDLTGSPVMEVASKQNTTVNSPFEFTDPVEGYYYVIAWKDLNGDGVISDKDIVGIHGGTYSPGHGGSQVMVKDGQTTDCGEIVMAIYKELKTTTSGSRSDGGYQTDLVFSFNYDVTLSRFSVVFPDEPGVEYEDNTVIGAKTAGTQSTSSWRYGTNLMPAGNHILRFQGTWETTAFDISVTVAVN